MKLFFSKDDSLYKILKRLEKIPANKQVQMFIDPEHAFFDNQWRGQQVKEIISTRKLNITFYAEQATTRSYFQQLGLQIQEKKERPIFKLLKTFSLFLFNSKKFHLFTQNKQQYLTYLIFGLEVGVGILLLWFLFALFMPSATINIKVAQNSENIIYNFRYYPQSNKNYKENIKQLSIPYYTGEINYEYQLNISTDNIQHISKPSKGTVKIYNRTPNEYNLLAQTRFISSDGSIFLSDTPLKIPAGSENKASEIKAKLTAAEYDEAGKLIGVRGNLTRGSKLSIKNIKDSHLLQYIWAEAIDPFQGGSTNSLGIVSEKDHKILTEKLTEGIYREKYTIVKNNFQDKEGIVFIHDPLIKSQIKNISIEGKIGDKTTNLRGKAQVSYSFLYLKWEDLITTVGQYIKERQSDNIQLISIDPNTLNFIYENLKTQQIKTMPTSEHPTDSTKAFPLLIIPTKIKILQGYDFKRDTKGILSAIKNSISGKTVSEAQKIIQSYSEISSSTINLGLLGGEFIPNIKSRIKIHVEY